MLLNINYNTLLNKNNRNNKDYINILKKEYNINIEKYVNYITIKIKMKCN